MLGCDRPINWFIFAFIQENCSVLNSPELILLLTQLAKWGKEQEQHAGQSCLMLFFVTRLTLELILQSSVLLVSDSVLITICSQANVTRRSGIDWLLSRYLFI